MIEIKDFKPQDAVDLTDETKRDFAIQTPELGPTYSLYMDGRLTACGGVRIVLLGEAWALFAKDAFDSLTKTKVIYKTAREQLKRYMAEQGLDALIAEAENFHTWKEHLGFKKIEIYMRAGNGMVK